MLHIKNTRLISQDTQNNNKINIIYCTMEVSEDKYSMNDGTGL